MHQPPLHATAIGPVSPTRYRVRTGLDRLAESPPPVLTGRRLGLLCNPASIGSDLTHARDILSECCPGQLTALFSPQHGFFADKQDNMIESAHGRDPKRGIPIYSLYGETRQPTREMFDTIDVLVVDLQDVGTRVYTFAYTLSYCMEAARKWGKTIVVLDRPNPVDGLMVEGNCLTPDMASFVGRYPIPMRHGLTIGELARLFNGPFGIGCDLHVVPMIGWDRAMTFGETGLWWVPPSPNLPTPASAWVYPGQVVWEGTNVSEGRGTTTPFEVFGAPFINPDRVAEALDPADLIGCHLRPVAFEPVAQKFAGQLCHGFQIHVTDTAQYHPYRTSLALVAAVISSHRDSFAWKSPPYEYEYRRRPIDLILGDAAIRPQLENQIPMETIMAPWGPDLTAFMEIRRSVLLYPASGIERGLADHII